MPAADADQRLAAAARRERHAECRTASRRRCATATGPWPRCRSSSRNRPSPCFQSAAPAIATAIASSHMRMRRQSPTCNDVGDGAHGAEIGAIGDGAENDREREGQPGNFARQMIEVLHRAIIACGVNPGRRGSSTACSPVDAAHPFESVSDALSRSKGQPCKRSGDTLRAGRRCSERDGDQRRGTGALADRTGQRRDHRPHRRSRAADLLPRGTPLRDRQAGQRIRDSHSQRRQRARAGGDERRRRQCDHRRHAHRRRSRVTCSAPFELRDRWLAHEHVAHGSVLLHDAAEFLRRAHRAVPTTSASSVWRCSASGREWCSSSAASWKDSDAARDEVDRAASARGAHRRSAQADAGAMAEKNRRSAPDTAAAKPRTRSTPTSERASDTPSETIAIYYDSYENLLAQGVPVAPAADREVAAGAVPGRRSPLRRRRRVDATRGPDAGWRGHACHCIGPLAYWAGHARLRRDQRRRPDARLCRRRRGGVRCSLRAPQRAASIAICCANAARVCAVDELFQDVWMNLIRARASYTPIGEVRDLSLPPRAQPA